MSYIPLIAQAANVRDGDNPSYTAADFLKYYPQFTDLVPDVVLASFVELAHACVKKARYKTHWWLCFGLFVAHLATLWLQCTPDGDNPSAQAVMAACEAHGVVTSESADGVSYSTDFGSLAGDLSGWAAFKATAFGVQFATTAKMLGKGGMYVW
jgi:hypothetical protein